MASEDDYDMNSSAEDLNNSQLTEEDLIDSLFLTCDLDKIGKVPVTRLIEYLKSTTSSISEVKNFIMYIKIYMYNVDKMHA